MQNHKTFTRTILCRKNENKIPIIGEIKCYSPLHGDLLRGRNVIDLASSYVDAGVSCISVVTGKWFRGTMAMLENVCKHVNIPVLHKDFITSKRQVNMSKNLGASAVLLTKKLLLTRHLEKLVEYCLTVDIVPFVEISHSDDLNNLKFNPNVIVAFNNKRIESKESNPCDVLKGTAVLPYLKSSGAPLCVSASGLYSPEEVYALFQAGFDAFLIGTALMRSNNIRETVRQFSCID